MIKRAKRIWRKLYSNNLIKNYIWVFIGQNVGTVFSMLSLIITLRIISTYDYGLLVIIQTYAALISGLFGIRTFNGVIKYITDAESDNDILKMKQYVNTAFVLDILSGIFAIVFGIVLLNPITYLMEWDTEMLNMVFWYLPIVIFSPILQGTPIGILRKLDRFKNVNIIHSIVYGMQMLCLLIAYLSNVHNFIVVLFIYALTETTECIILLIYSIYTMINDEKYSGFWKEGISKDLSFLKYNLLYGLTLSFDQLLGNVSTLLINKFVGNFATAYLKVITKICGLFTKFTNPIGQILYPELCVWVSKNDYKKAYKISMKFLFIICVAGLVLTGIMFGTYDFWIKIFDPSMIDAKWESLLYMIFTVLSISMIAISQLIFALGLVKYNLIFVVVCNLIYIIVLIPIIQTYGIYGYLFLQIAQLVLVALGKIVAIVLNTKKRKESKC